MSDKKSRPKKHTVFIVDDHPLLRNGLAELINQTHDLRVIGEAQDAQSAITDIPKCKPDVAIVDISLERMNGVELIKHLKALCPDQSLLVLSMHDESIYAERSLRAGARGYVMKEQPPDTVLKALRTVLSGEIYLSESMATQILEKTVTPSNKGNQSPIELLSDRELEIFEMIGKGLRPREIAQALNISVKTVDYHRDNVKKKLKLKTSTAVLQHATRWVEK